MFFYSTWATINQCVAPNLLRWFYIVQICDLDPLAIVERWYLVFSAMEQYYQEQVARLGNVML